MGRSAASSSAGGRYEVEIRDLAGRTNSCGCVDHRVNGLGTCKHIEGVLFALKKKLGARAFARGGGQRLAARGSLSSARRRSGPLARRTGPERRGARLSRSLPRRGRRALHPIRRRWRGSSRPRRARRPISGSRAISAPGSSARGGSRRARRRGRNSSPRSGGPRQLRCGQAAAPALSAGGRGASRLSRTCAPGRRDGARQDRAGHRRLRDSGAGEGRRARARRLAHLRQSRMGRADRPLHESGRPLCRGALSGAAQAL